jgi:hypothetical protein
MGFGSRIRDPRSGNRKNPIADPGSKSTGSETLRTTLIQPVMQYRYGSTNVKYTTWNPIFIAPTKNWNWFQVTKMMRAHANPDVDPDPQPWSLPLTGNTDISWWYVLTWPLPFLRLSADRRPATAMQLSGSGAWPKGTHQSEQLIYILYYPVMWIGNFLMTIQIDRTFY